MVERASVDTLEMNISKGRKTLGSSSPKDTILWPAQNAHTHDRMADIRTLHAAVPLVGIDVVDGLPWR